MPSGGGWHAVTNLHICSTRGGALLECFESHSQTVVWHLCVRGRSFHVSACEFYTPVYVPHTCVGSALLYVPHTCVGSTLLYVPHTCVGSALLYVPHTCVDSSLLYVPYTCVGSTLL